MGKSAEVLFLRAKLAKLKEKNDVQATAYLKEALAVHIAKLNDALPRYFT